MLPQGLRIYAVGDVHGRLDLLEELAAKIERDLKDQPADRTLEVFLGDYVDRGPQSRDVIEWLIKTPPLTGQRLCLLGNHEDMLLAAAADPEVVPTWLHNGGDATLLSYGLETLPSAPKAVHEAIVAAIPQRHLNFLNTLDRKVEFGSYLFVHAGINPERPLHDQDPRDMIWIREPFLRSADDFGRIVVHGHTPVGQADFHDNRINIDTGAVFTGCLTALVLEGATQRLLQTPRRD